MLDADCVWHVMGTFHCALKVFGVWRVTTHKVSTLAFPYKMLYRISAVADLGAWVTGVQEQVPCVWSLHTSLPMPDACCCDIARSILDSSPALAFSYICLPAMA